MNKPNTRSSSCAARQSGGQRIRKRPARNEELTVRGQYGFDVRPEKPANRLLRVRDAIDGVDAAIAGLLVTRRRLVRMAVETKFATQIPMRDPDRESAIMRAYNRMAPGSYSISRAILRWSQSGYVYY